jgi:16S rRNA (adenine1518-N6/adenine1519-N6)-dimethyltransferase
MGGVGMLREETLRLMKKHDITLDPSFDEQQLVDPGVIERLIGSAEVNPLDTALDIGAGLGNITVPLAGSVRRVYAVEKNPKFLPALRERTAGLGNVVIVHGDALRIGLPPFTKIASNLPFAICEPFIQRLFPLQFERASLIVPVSYARILTAHPDDQGYTKLTLVASAFFGIRHVGDVEPEAYLPQPGIATSILTLEPRVAEGRGEDVLRRVILQADKKLKNALRESLIGSSRVFDAPETKREANAFIGSMGIGQTILEKRVSRLSLADLKKVSECL